MTAKYYIYRNLHTPNAEGFSVRHKGKVVDKFTVAHARDVTLKVNPGGNALVRKQKQKYVHAFVVVDDYMSCDVRTPTLPHMEITYNPYVDNSFIWKDNGEQVFHVDLLILKKGKIYGIVNPS